MKPKTLKLDLAEASRLIICLRNAVYRLQERRALRKKTTPVNKEHALEIELDIKYWIEIERQYEELAERIERLWSK